MPDPLAPPPNDYAFFNRCTALGLTPTCPNGYGNRILFRCSENNNWEWLFWPHADWSSAPSALPLFLFHRALGMIDLQPEPNEVEVQILSNYLDDRLKALLETSPEPAANTAEPSPL